MDINNEYGCRDIQWKLLEMLKDFHAFCQMQKITYSLSGGSLLGAIRHNGFIPWDDDVDIFVDRKNHEKLISSFDKCPGYKIERRNLWLYRIRKEEETKDYGVTTIDVFTLDHVPDTELGKKTKLLLVAVVRGMLKDSVTYKGRSLPVNAGILLSYLLGRLFPGALKRRLYDFVAQIGNNKPTKCVTAYDDLFRYLQVYYDADIMEHIILHDFEDTQLCVVEQYDAVLTAAYGDYMTPPPVEMRVPEHGVSL